MPGGAGWCHVRWESRVAETPPITNILTVDVEEYYHGVEFAAALAPHALERLPSRVVPQTERLLDLLDCHGARATFFTLGVVAQRFPRLIRSIVARGHELASHGWNHTPVYRLDPEAFRLDVRRARQVLESAGGRPVRGYRAPNYSIRDDTAWALAILAEEGHTYDSSVHPIAHDRYGFPNAPRFVHAAPGGAVWEVPVGTARTLGTNLPVGGGFFRLFPTPLLREAIANVNRRERRPVVLYVHPWELDPGQPRPPMPWRHSFRHYAGLAGAERKLRSLLTAFRFTTIESALRAVRVAPAPLARAS
jgi:polysaccharide deacetylase family protein (PEP-CTERM system associated)